MLTEFARLSVQRVDFAFESTLGGRACASRLKHLRDSGYDIEVIFLRLASPRLAVQRISARVRQGGHPFPKADVLRRFDRGWDNFRKVYRPLAHIWSVYDNSDSEPNLIERGP